MSDHDEWEAVPEIGGMYPWTCSYYRDGARYAITLYGTDPDQILNDHCADLPGLSVDGMVMSQLKEVKRRK